MNEIQAGTPVPRKQIATFEELASQVDRNGGVFTVTMGELRNAYEARKLGTHVRTGISEKLRTRGLRHLPEELPLYQEQVARIYRDGSSVGKIIDAAVYGIGDHSDDLLREAAGGDAAEVLQKIRELVCP